MIAVMIAAMIAVMIAVMAVVMIVGTAIIAVQTTGVAATAAIGKAHRKRPLSKTTSSRSFAMNSAISGRAEARIVVEEAVAATGTPARPAFGCKSNSG